jgi:ParB-like chromosome segregation protein Spo0J
MAKTQIKDGIRREAQDAVREGNLREAPLMRIVPSRWQPRGAVFDAEKLLELAKSIQDNGLINLPWVFELPAAEGEARYFELVAGERRVRALTALAWARTGEVKLDEAVGKLAEGGLASVPKKVAKALEDERITAHVVPAEDLLWLHRVAVVENIERESLAPLEEANALASLQEHEGWSQRELARHIGKSQSFVAQRLSLRDAAAASPELAEAVNTRALSPTHVRAIGTLPAALQPAFTAWATKAVADGDSPATTRKVAQWARELAAFVSPERWMPQEGETYTAMERNRLLLLKWAAEHADLIQQADALLDLADHGYPHNNLLGAKVNLFSTSWHFMRIALTALGFKGHETVVWEENAAPALGRTCETCILGQVQMSVDDEAAIEPYCPRWKNPNLKSCLHFIGAGEPISIDTEDADWFEEAGVTFDEQGNFGSVDAYVAGYQKAVELKLAADAAEEQKEARGYLDDIQAFMDWQATLPAEAAPGVDFYGHFCAKCVHHRPEREGAERCAFADKPVKADYMGGLRGPHFGVLVMKNNQMLPRCEQFAYRDVPRLWQVEGVHFADPAMPLRWLAGLLAAGKSTSGNWWLHQFSWGVFRWLPYNRPADKDDLERLVKWVKNNWDALGGDGAIATLLDVTVGDAEAVRQAKGDKALSWFNPVAHGWQEFVGTDFDTVRRGERKTYGWPKGWPQPWAKKQEARGKRQEAEGDDVIADEGDEEAEE